MNIFERWWHFTKKYILLLLFRMGPKKQTVSKWLRVESSSPSPSKRYRATKAANSWRSMRVFGFGLNGKLTMYR